MITQSAVRRIGLGAGTPNAATLTPCPCPPSASKILMPLAGRSRVDETWGASPA